MHLKILVYVKLRAKLHIVFTRLPDVTSKILKAVNMKTDKYFEVSRS